MKDRARRPIQGLVAFVAGYRDVRSSQRETCLLMHCQRHVRLLEAALAMALFAPISPRLAGKLALVNILMAIDAQGKLDPVSRLSTRGDMALRALRHRMRSHQWESRRSMITQRVGRRLEAIDGMAALTATMVRSLGKLVAVRTRLMAVRTLLMCDRRLEVPSPMTSQTRNFKMLSR